MTIDHAKLTGILEAMDFGESPSDLATAIITEYDKPDERIWECKIGGHVNIPDGADAPMRAAVERAFYDLTGRHSEFTLSGWGGTLTAAERELEDRVNPPCHSKPRSEWCDRDGEYAANLLNPVIGLDQLLGALKSYVTECDRPGGKFEAEHMYDVATAFFRSRPRNYQALPALEKALTDWVAKKERLRRPSPSTQTLIDIARRYFRA